MTSDALPACYGTYDASHECQRCRSLPNCYLAEQKRLRKAERKDSEREGKGE